MLQTLFFFESVEQGAQVMPTAGHIMPLDQGALLAKYLNSNSPSVGDVLFELRLEPLAILGDEEALLGHEDNAIGSADPSLGAEASISPSIFHNLSLHVLIRVIGANGVVDASLEGFQDLAPSSNSEHGIQSPPRRG
ncbi:hypothetical protein M758_UG008400 [Ceratodon purpureus]|nr:hypothetical protein M758_UG008400 [Ceratodon purpureus]